MCSFNLKSYDKDRRWSSSTGYCCTTECQPGTTDSSSDGLIQHLFGLRKLHLDTRPEHDGYGCSCQRGVVYIVCSLFLVASFAQEDLERAKKLVAGLGEEVRTR